MPFSHGPTGVTSTRKSCSFRTVWILHSFDRSRHPSPTRYGSGSRVVLIECGERASSRNFLSDYPTLSSSMVPSRPMVDDSVNFRVGSGPAEFTLTAMYRNRKCPDSFRGSTSFSTLLRWVMVCPESRLRQWPRDAAY